MTKINKQADIDEIIRRYEDGESCVQLGRAFGVAQGTISKVLKDHGITVTNRQNLAHFTDAEILEDYCDNNLSLTQMAKKYKASVTRLGTRLRKLGIDVENWHNKAKFNENIFDCIDTEEKAYGLGFIYADGYISSLKSSNKKKYTFELSLSAEDIEHLNKFNKFMEYDGDNVKTGIVKGNGKIYHRCRGSVGNKHLGETLNSYGCVPNKSLILKFPDIKIFAKENLIIPFIRGYFDGDGCVSLAHCTTSKYPTLCASMLGTKEFLEPIQNLFYQHRLYLNNPNNQQTYVYSMASKQAYVFLSIIYYNASIYLDRKRQKFVTGKNCRPKVKALGLLEGKIGEDGDVNPELTYMGNTTE